MCHWVHLFLVAQHALLCTGASSLTEMVLTVPCRTNLIQLRLYFEELSVSKVEQVPAYTGSALFGEPLSLATKQRRCTSVQAVQPSMLLRRYGFGAVRNNDNYSDSSFLSATWIIKVFISSKFILLPKDQ